MSEHPIIFQGWGVQAILAGTKTQTRRVIRKQPAGAWAAPGRTACLYGRPGDLLWCRETWGIDPNDYGYPEDQRQVHVVYRADNPERPYHWGWRPSIHMPRWACGLFLRLIEVRVQRVQEITEEDARAEGVDSHNWGDMIWWGDCWTDERNLAVSKVSPTELLRGPRAAFAAAWFAINGKHASWESNPWVWALTFERVLSASREAGGSRQEGGG